MKPPIAVTATLVGAFVDECGTGALGTIASLHDSVVNVRVRSDRYLLSLVRGAVDMSDRAICVPDDKGWALFRGAAGAAESDAPVVRRRDALVLGAPPLSVSVELTAAAPWSGRLEPLLADIPAATVRSAMDRLAVEVARKGGGFAALAHSAAGGEQKDAAPSSTPDPNWTRRAGSTPGDDPFLRKARLLLAESKKGNGPERLNALHGVVGLGRGFTPSGDDFIAGAVLACAARGVPLPDTVIASIREALDRTTPGGATLLDLALRGSHPAYQLEFVRRFVAGMESADFSTALAVLESHGATSGFDMAAGFCWAGTAL